MTRPAIIIFGAAVRPDGRPSGALQHRIEAALLTGRRIGPALYVPTGGQGRFGPPEAEVMADGLRAGGVPASDILLEPTGRNTIGSVRACAALLGPSRATVYVATSRYHLLRCTVLLRLAGLRARPGQLPPAPFTARQGYWWAREAAALPVDIASMLIGKLRR